MKQTVNWWRAKTHVRSSTRIIFFYPRFSSIILISKTVAIIFWNDHETVLILYTETDDTGRNFMLYSHRLNLFHSGDGSFVEPLPIHADVAQQASRGFHNELLVCIFKWIFCWINCPQFSLFVEQKKSSRLRLILLPSSLQSAFLFSEMFCPWTDTW